jgi:hypothetical protein
MVVYHRSAAGSLARVLVREGCHLSRCISKTCFDDPILHGFIYRDGLDMWVAFGVKTTRVLTPTPFGASRDTKSRSQIVLDCLI